MGWWSNFMVIYPSKFLVILIVHVFDRRLKYRQNRRHCWMIITNTVRFVAVRGFTITMDQSFQLLVYGILHTTRVLIAYWIIYRTQMPIVDDEVIREGVCTSRIRRFPVYTVLVMLFRVWWVEMNYIWLLNGWRGRFRGLGRVRGADRPTTRRWRCINASFVFRAVGRLVHGVSWSLFGSSPKHHVVVQVSLVHCKLEQKYSLKSENYGHWPSL